jgi:hypothetical protein
MKTWADSPELDALRKAWAEGEALMQAEDQAWWDSLTMEERARAFRKVIGLMYEAEVEKRGSYRFAMYEIFGVDYIDGMVCNYMELHNLINKALSFPAPESPDP